MDEVIKFITNPSVWGALFVIGVVWRFSYSIKKDLKEERRELKEEMKEIHKEFKFINIRLSRVEGTVYGKDIYKPSPQEEVS